MVSGEETEGMSAKEMMCGFVVDLAGDAEEGEDFLAAEDGEGVRVEIDDLRRGEED